MSFAPQARAATKITLSGQAMSGPITADPSGHFVFPNLPLHRNSVNTFTVTATDDAGQSMSRNVTVTQISLDSVVVSKIKAQPLSVPEVQKLVSDGVIKLDNPANFNVSKFDIVLTIGKQEVSVSLPLALPIIAPTTGYETLKLPRGDGGGGGSNPPPVDVVVFEQFVAGPPGQPPPPPIPGVIIIEGRIKTLKEFFSVRLLLMNMSGIFTLHDVVAKISFPDGGLSSTLPEDGIVAFGDILPGDVDVPGQKEREFIIRGDQIGVRGVRVDFGGVLIGPGIPVDAPIPFNGGAETTVEVKGPPLLKVQVIHPPAVVKNVPYELTIDIANVGETPALYGSLELDVGADAQLVDCVIDPASGTPSCTPIVGSAVRSLGDLLPGQTTRQKFTINPLDTGPITSCMGQADQNITLQVHIGSLGCLVGSAPPPQGTPDGIPSVSVLPVPNTFGVGIDSPVVAFFSDAMNTGTISTGDGGTFNVFDSAGKRVPGQLRFVDLSGKTVAVWQVNDGVTNRLAPDTTYTASLSSTISNLKGFSLPAPWVSKFTTTNPFSDSTPPALTLSVEPPVNPNFVLPGQLVRINAYASDAGSGVERIELSSEDTNVPGSTFSLIDQKTIFSTISGPCIFSIDSGKLIAGHTYQFKGTAIDHAGNRQDATIAVILAPSAAAPTITLPPDPASPVLRGISVPIMPASFTGGVVSISYFLDGATSPFAAPTLQPFSATVDTLTLALGLHTVRAVASDGLGQTGQATLHFTLADNPSEPVVSFSGAANGAKYIVGSPIAIHGTATDPVGITSMQFFLDNVLGTPVATGSESFTIASSTLPLGTHKVFLKATNKLGVTNHINDPSAALSFDVVPVPSGPPPAAPVVTNVSLPVGGVVTVTGTAGNSARIDVTNTTRHLLASFYADASGAFHGTIDGDSGDQLSLVTVQLTVSATPSSPTLAVVPAPPALDHITVSPTSRTFTTANATQDVTVTGFFVGGSSSDVTAQATFSSDHPSVASVNAAGRIVGLASGTATITASLNGKSATVAVTVSIRTLVSIQLTPATFTLIGAGKTKALTVTGTFSDSTTQALTSGVSFGSSDAGVATVSPAGVATSAGVGTATITAAVSGLPPAQSTATVVAIAADGLIVSPSSVTLTAAGQMQALTVLAHLNDGSTAPVGGPVTFSSRDIKVVTVSGTGVVSAVANGLTIVDVGGAGFSVPVNVVVNIPSSNPPPEITALGRPIAGEGDTLVILGHHFAPLPGQNLVTIHGINANVTGASGDRLIVIVPSGATTGLVQVTVSLQASNTMTLAIYPRHAQAFSITGPFSLTPASSGQTVDMGGPTIDVRAGDQVWLTGDPNTIIGAQFSGLPAPNFQGQLSMMVGGSPISIAPSSAPINLTSFFSPGVQATSFRLRESSGQLSSTGLFLVVGPANTGPLAGERTLTADTFAHTVTVHFRGLPLADGDKVAVTDASWFNLDGACCNSSVGGSVTNGVVTPNDGRFKTFTVTKGDVAVTYSDEGLLGDVGQTLTAWLSLVPAGADGSKTADTPLARAPILLGGIDSASIIPAQLSSLADGQDRPMTVTINSVRDVLGVRVPDGSGFALTAANWFNRDGACCNGSVGGGFNNGTTAVNDGRFKVFSLASGTANPIYTPAGIVLTVGDVRQSILAAVVSDGANNKRPDKPFAVASITLSSPSAANAIITTVPSTLPATTFDNRSVLTIQGLSDAGGQPLPDGTKIGLTAGSWFNLDGTCCNSSVGGAIIGGVTAVNDSRFQILAISGGQVVAEYSNAGLVLEPDQTATAIVSLVPASGSSKTGDRPFGSVAIQIGGIHEAAIVPAQNSVVADGQSRPIGVTISGLKDTLGDAIPDGTKIGLTASSWFDRSGVCCNGSIGGFTDGTTAANDGRFAIYPVVGGTVHATFDAVGIKLDVGTIRQAIISAVAADDTNNKRIDKPFATASLTLSSATGTLASLTAVPASLLADTQAHTSVITISGLTDSSGRAVPDGTKLALTAANWFNLDGGCCNDSVGGGFTDGTTAANDGRFKVFTLTGGKVVATYTDAGLLRDTGQVSAAIVSVLPADGTNNKIGDRPLARTTVTLAGMGSATVNAPATVLPSSSTTVTLTNLLDAFGVSVPDGTRVALTVANWFNPDGGCCNSSAGGTLTGGTTAANDGRFSVYTVSGGKITATFQAPAPNNVTSVLSAVSADASNNKQTDRPFAIGTIRVTTSP